MLSFLVVVAKVATVSLYASTMSSGDLPLATYHRAEALGSGTYGSVITVYDDEGESHALKMFDQEDEDEDVGISLGALREISILRLFRGANAHPNIIEIHDVNAGFGEEEEGAGTSGVLSMAMPIFPRGSLEDSLSMISSKKQKIELSHGILNAVAYLHHNGIIHRDIKCDNILLQDTENDSLFPVLIDFSLAKIVEPNKIIPGKRVASAPIGETETTHTPEIGTPTYRAPEVIDKKEYSLPSDIWSLGVCCLEILREKCLEVDKDKNATKLVTESLSKLPDAPFPNLIRGLLETDPDKRLTARQALDSPVFQKFGLKTYPKTFSLLNIKDAIPFQNDDDIFPVDEKENQAIPSKSNKKKRSRVDPVLVKRFTLIEKICSSMEWSNPMTTQAALTYSIQFSELDDVDDLDNSQGLLDCIVLAHKFFERHLTDLEELPQVGGRFENWDREQYEDNEATLFMMLDFSLYPRYFLDV